MASGACLDALFRELFQKKGKNIISCAMAGRYTFYAKLFQGPYGGFKPFPGCVEQVHAANNCMNRRTVRER
mgnify:CR=1 FL=1